MFGRAEACGSDTCTRIVKSHREDKKVRRCVIAILAGPRPSPDQRARGRLRQFAWRVSERLATLAARPGGRNGEDDAIQRHTSPAPAFESPQVANGHRAIVHALFVRRRLRFHIERPVFAAALHRIALGDNRRLPRRISAGITVSGSRRTARAAKSSTG